MKRRLIVGISAVLFFLMFGIGYQVVQHKGKALMEGAECQVSMTVTLGDKVLENNNIYTVNGGEEIIVEASSSVSGIKCIGYYYQNGDGTKMEEIVDIYSDKISIIIPEVQLGTRKILRIEAIADNDDGTENTITKTGWHNFILQYGEGEDDVKTVEGNVKFNGNILPDRSTTETAVPGDELELISSPNDKVRCLWYRWDDDDFTKVSDTKATIEIPTTFEYGTTHYLYFVVRDNDGIDTEQKVYKFIIPE